jgi:hypothetical protein
VIVAFCVVALWLAAALLIVSLNRVANGPRRATKPANHTTRRRNR